MKTMRHLKSLSVQALDDDLALLLPNGVYEIKKMELKPPRRRRLIFFLLFVTLAGLLLTIGYFCPDNSYYRRFKQDLMANTFTANNYLNGNADKMNDVINLGQPVTINTGKFTYGYEDMIREDFTFDLNATDVIVFLHMQKTGGTSFGKHLVYDLNLERPCRCPLWRKRCNCFRPHSNQNWLFSRYTIGWKCGLHADWTELTSCVDTQLDRLERNHIKRRYFYITLLRNPIARYLSEFKHVQRGATWNASRHWCNGRSRNTEIAACYPGDDWSGVQLDEFIACGTNLAQNRQTRMLADLALIGCYNRSYMPREESERVMLASAKRNLAAMAFFGLTERQIESQYIFEKTFNLKFVIDFEQYNETISTAEISTLDESRIAKIKRLNRLDLELYTYAKQLMLERLDALKDREKPHLQKNHINNNEETEDNDKDKSWTIGNGYSKKNTLEMNGFD